MCLNLKLNFLYNLLVLYLMHCSFIVHCTYCSFNCSLTLTLHSSTWSWLQLSPTASSWPWSSIYLRVTRHPCQNAWWVYFFEVTSFIGRHFQQWTDSELMESTQSQQCRLLTFPRNTIVPELQRTLHLSVIIYGTPCVIIFILIIASTF